MEENRGPGESEAVFDNVYEIGDTIKKGGFSAVYECINRQTDQKYIVKIISLKKARRELSDFNNEETRLETLKYERFKHKYCSQLFETYISKELLFTVSEYVYGKDIGQEIVERAKSGFVYSENVVSYYFRQILDGLIYCHSFGIIHGNLNPNSVLVNTALSSCPIKIVGFGYSILGSLPPTKFNQYIAPELRTGRQIRLTEENDAWAVGALLYTLLSGFWISTITDIDSYEKLIYNISTSPTWASISQRAQHLVIQLLNPAASTRICLRDARENEWIKNRDSCGRKSHLTYSVLGLHKCQRVRSIIQLADECCLQFDGEECNTDLNNEGPKNKVIKTVTDTCSINYDGTLVSKVERSLLSMFAANKDCKVLVVPDLHESAFLCYSEVMNGLPECDASLKGSLKQLLSSPHILAIFKIQDVIINHVFKSKNSSKETECGDEELSLLNDEKAPVKRIRLVHFEKSPNEAMGITLKLDENGKCIVSRIMIGGLIYRQATLNVGDEIIEINDYQVAGQSIESLQRLLRDACGQVSFKIIPSNSKHSIKQCSVYIRAQFDYNPRDDPLIPCPSQEIGLDFNTGDILKVINKEDYYWWQAVKEGETESGLIPSPQLQEWRISFNNNEQEGKVKKSFSLGKCKLFKGNHSRKKRLHPLYQLKPDIPCYEEVVQVPAYNRKTLILIGAHGVGRRHIKNTLISNYPSKYSYPIPHTSRLPRKGEEDGKHYFFVTEEQMLLDISNNAYLEYGTHEGDFYGTKMQTIKDIIELEGKIAILDIEPQSLLLLRNATFSPFVVFIAAPTIIASIEKDMSLCRLSRESDYLLASYRHLFDLVIVNNDIEETVKSVERSFTFFNANPQWVPVNWVY